MNKNCKNCQAQYEITQEDLDFYDKVSPVFGWKKYDIPTPTFCPDCRQQRKLAWRNERKLYKRKCNATGKNIISIYSPDKPYKVYSQEEWWSDKWNWTDYWVDFDFSKPFFEQFRKLMLTVPRLSLLSKNSENSEYINHWSNNKDCYLSTIIFNSENVLHSRKIYSSSMISDSWYIFEKWEMLYECFWWENLYNCKYCSICLDSSNLFFCIDCKWCSDCFMSYNLRNKKYCFYNEQLSKEEYEKRIREIDLWNYSVVQKLLNELSEKNIIHKNLNNEYCEDSTWDFLLHCNNVKECYLASWWEDCKYCVEFDYSANHTWSKDCMDSFWFWASELLYEVQSQANWYNNKFSNFSYDVAECTYIDNCHDSKYLFGCIWIKNESYCILNKKYSKEEYEKLVPRIIEHMKKTWDWWEFFPIEISPFCYNETIAEDYFPLSKEEVVEKWWYPPRQTRDLSPDEISANSALWKDEDGQIPDVSKVIPAEKLPDNIKDIPDDILAWAIKCEVSWRPFKIIPQELEFYREHNIPVPHLHPDERYKKRMELRNPRELYDRRCDKCSKDMKTTYAPSSVIARKQWSDLGGDISANGLPQKNLSDFSSQWQPIVYCEECYLKEVY